MCPICQLAPVARRVANKVLCNNCLTVCERIVDEEGCSFDLAERTLRVIHDEIREAIAEKEDAVPGRRARVLAPVSLDKHSNRNAPGSIPSDWPDSA